MTENVTATNPRGQTPPTISLSYVGEPGICWKYPFLERGTDSNAILGSLYPTLQPNTTQYSTYLFTGEKDRLDTITHMQTAEVFDTDFGWPETEYPTTSRSPIPELISKLGLWVYTPKSFHTTTLNQFISYFHADGEEIDSLIEILHSRILRGHTVGTFPSTQESSAVDEKAHRLAEMEELLRRFAELAEDWDSYGGSPISHDIIDEARKILTAGINLNLPPAWAAPGGDGGIGIQWDNDQAELYIDIVPEEEITYSLTTKAGDGIEADGVLTNANLSGVLNKFAESPA